MIIYLLYLFFTIYASILIKTDNKDVIFNISNNILHFSLGIKLIFSMLCYVISFILWMMVLRKNNMGYILPITYGILNILTIIVSFTILKEPISFKIILGTIIISIGIIIMNIN